MRVPRPWPELSTGRLLTLDWLEGDALLAHKDDPLAVRNALAHRDVHRLVVSVQPLWRHPRRSASRQLHGLRCASKAARADAPAGINLLDYGCIRIFPPQFVRGVVDLYHGLLHGDDASWCTPTRPGASAGSSRELIDTLNIWARFIYGPLLDDRVRTIADGVAPSEYGRREAFRVHQALKQKGPVTVPREFVFMDRAAIGLGAVFLHLRAELNFYRLFNEAIEHFSMERVAERQQAALSAAGL